MNSLIEHFSYMTIDVCTYVSMHARMDGLMYRMYGCTDVRASAYACMYACRYVCMLYVCVYVCSMHACMDGGK